jgi:hypothetical protein
VRASVDGGEQSKQGNQSNKGPPTLERGAERQPGARAGGARLAQRSGCMLSAPAAGHASALRRAVKGGDEAHADANGPGERNRVDAGGGARGGAGGKLYRPAKCAQTEPFRGLNSEDIARNSEYLQKQQ